MEGEKKKRNEKSGEGETGGWIEVGQEERLRGGMDREKEIKK